MAYVEETIVLKDTKLEEINKYYIQDNLNETERITYILKKGYTCQKENLVKNLCYLYFKNYPVNKSLIHSTVVNLMENIELLNKETQLLIAESLGKIAIELRKRNDNKETNTNSTEIKNIFMHFFTAISTLEKTVSDEYILNLNNVINDYAANNFRINVDSSLIEYANTLGKFGQNVKNRQFSAFLCICLLRIAKHKNNEIDNRLLFLCNDNESAIKYEMSYQIRFILDENNSEFCSEHLIETITHFLTQSDLAFCSIFIESMLYKNNICKLQKHPDIVEAFINRVNQIFNIDDFCILKIDFGFISTIFINVLSHAYENDTKRKMFIKGIKMYLMNYFIVSEKKNSANTVITFKIEECLDKLYKIIKVFILEKDKQFVNDVVNVAMKYYFRNENNISLLYNNLHLIIKEICSEQQIMLMLLTKMNMHKIFFFFDIDDAVLNTTNTSTSSSERNCISNTKNANIRFIVNINTVTMFIDQNNNNNNNNKVNVNLFCDFNEIWYKHINSVTKILLSSDNTEYISYIIPKLQNISFLIKHTKSWRMQKTLLNTLSKFPKHLAFNFQKYPLYEESLHLMFTLCKDILSINRNIQIESHTCKLITQLILFSKTRTDILSYMKNTFLFNTSFYRRRIYCFFLKYAFRSFSLDYLKKKQIYSNAIDVLLVGEIPLIQTLLIDILIKNEIYEEDALRNIQTIQQTSLSREDVELQGKIRKYMDRYEEGKGMKREGEEERKGIEMKVENVEKEIEENCKRDEMLFKRPKTKQRTPGGGVFGIKKTKTKVCSSKEVKKFEEMGKMSVGNNKKMRKTSMNNNGSSANDGNGNSHGFGGGINLSSSVNLTRPKKNIGSNTATNYHYTSNIINARTSFKSPYSSKK